MKAGAFLPCLLVFAASAYVGYQLTAISFAWVDLPNFGLPQAGATTAATGTSPTFPAIDLEALKAQLTPELLEKFRHITSLQLTCLKTSIDPDHVQAIMRGILVPEDAPAIKNCLK